MPLPKIIIIGAAKCGTTALWYNLGKHPGISMATRNHHTVEMHFWASKFWDNGLDWYSGRFEEGKIGGEKSTEYFCQKKSMQAIKDHIPDAKIIMCVRNPVDRGYSQFQMHQRRSGGALTNFNFKPYANLGKYMRRLERNVLPIFDDIHICIAEHMKKDITLGMKNVFDFIGVEDIALPGKIIHGVLLKDKTRQEDIKLSRSENFYRVWSKHTERLKGKERKIALEHFEPFNEKLFDYLGYEIEEWKV